MPPPIRYPLPSLVALGLAALLTWKGAEWSRSWRAEMAARLQRAVEGPPVPSSPRPKVVLGPITARALLLRDGVPATTRPNGPVAETIDRRMFVDVYDRWPDDARPSFLRVGNRKVIGWVPVVDALAWDTRLVVQAPGGMLELSASPDGAKPERVEVGSASLPALGWTRDAVELAVWEPDQAWSRVRRTGWARLAELPPPAWGVWIGQSELPALLRLTLDGDPEVARVRAVLGRLSDSRGWTRADVDATRPALPPFVFAGAADAGGSADRLAEANARRGAEASWSGLSFRRLPLADFP